MIAESNFWRKDHICESFRTNFGPAPELWMVRSAYGAFAWTN